MVRLAVLLLLLPLPLYGQDEEAARAVLNAAGEVDALKTFVIFDASQSKGDRWTWELDRQGGIELDVGPDAQRVQQTVDWLESMGFEVTRKAQPDEPVYLLCNDGKVLVAPAIPEARYTAVFAISNGETIDSAIAQAVVKPLPGPRPIPPTPPGPNPPGPTPPPAPNLTGLAKLVYDAAKPLNDRANAARFAENYAAIVSAIGAGGYGTDVVAAKGRIIADLQTANKPIVEAAPAWNGVFQQWRGWMNERERGGQLNTLPAVTAAMEDTQRGFAEAAR